MSYLDDKSFADYVIGQGVCMAESTLLTLYVELHLRQRKYRLLEDNYTILQNAIDITHERIVKRMKGELRNEYTTNSKCST